MKVTVDGDTCTGCGLCADTCPEVFEMGDDIVAVIVPEVPEDAEETCREACEGCPVEALVLAE